MYSFKTQRNIISRNLLFFINTRTFVFILFIGIQFFLTPIFTHLTAASVDTDFIKIFGDAVSSTNNTSVSANELSTSTNKVSTQTSKNTIQNPNYEAKQRDLNGLNLAIHHVADTLGLFAISTTLFLLFFLTTLAFTAFYLNSSSEKRQHYEEMNKIIKARKWLTLITGILNGGVAVLIAVILLNTMHLIGFIFSAWLISIVLETISCRISSTSNSYRSTFEETLKVLPLFLIPIFGQVELFTCIFRGIGGKVLLKIGFNNKKVKKKNTSDLPDNHK